MPPKKNAEKKSEEDVPAAGKARTIEETYAKRDQREHTLLRPDTYIGSIEKADAEAWVADLSALRGAEPHFALTRRAVKYVPGLIKIFDEAIVNAADHATRDAGMNKMRVTIDRARGEITVWNNGRGIPIAVHAKEKVYVPELIFAHFLTGSSFNDAEGRVTGGRNGMGIKLTSVFSNFLRLETVSDGQKYVQTYRDNLGVIEKAKISASKGAEYTSVTFAPDLSRFREDEITEDTAALMIRRAIDMAGTLGGVAVYLTYVDARGEEVVRDARIELKASKVAGRTTNFRAYCDLYLSAVAEGRGGDIPAYAEAPPLAHEICNDRWEVAACLSPGNNFEQVSFVNAIATSRGGTHVQYVTEQLVKYLLDTPAVKKMAARGEALRPAQVRARLWVFVNCRIENPVFDSQTKEHMTLPPRALHLRTTDGGASDDMQGRALLTDSFLSKVAKGGVVDSLLEEGAKKQDALLKRSDGAKTGSVVGIAKLDDANMAGRRDAQRCTLILTEGDSAKALAVAGISAIAKGRDYYGVYPLRGKLLNVRDAPAKQVLENEEISDLKKILGLVHGKEYQTLESLRYGRLMIMTDQDHDGSHIKGLILNFLDVFFPSLLRISGFVVEFITPIVKATSKRDTKIFFTLSEFDTWSRTPGAERYSVKYYKGLGTSTTAEGKEYFSDLQRHVKPFAPLEDEGRELLDMVFNKKRANDRKQWLAEFVPGVYLDHAAVREITYDDFINKEFIQFSMADNIRSVPSVIDGLKPGQRKILHACFKRNLRNEIKVAQLGGYVAEHTAYHHGEASLNMTIVGMAQDFVGSNNLNLLMPNGQFGTRSQGGKDAASPRYIFTKLNDLARLVFPQSDDPLLDFLTEDGQAIEPKYFVPILPMVLINGISGIGTGWSSEIPCYNPLDVAQAVRDRIAGREPRVLAPWYRGFVGDIEIDEAAQRYTFLGRAVVSVQGRAMFVEIDELPIGKWTQTEKEYIESLKSPKEGQTAWVRDYMEYHTDTSVRFVVEMTAEGARAVDQHGAQAVFKLANTIATTNMVAFDAEGKIHRYNNTSEIIKEFYITRLELYSKRHAHLLAQIEHALRIARNRRRFIDEAHHLMDTRTSREKLVENLRARGYEAVVDAREKAGDEDPDDDADAREYQYLLKMPMSSLTQNRARALDAEIAKLTEEKRILERKTPKDLWGEDLEAFEKAYAPIVAAHRKTAGTSRAASAPAPALPRARTAKSSAASSAPKRATTAVKRTSATKASNAEGAEAPKRARASTAPRRPSATKRRTADA